MQIGMNVWMELLFIICLLWEFLLMFMGGTGLTWALHVIRVIKPTILGPVGRLGLKVCPVLSLANSCQLARRGILRVKRVWLSDKDWWLTAPDTVLDTWPCPGSRLSPGPGYWHVSVSPASGTPGPHPRVSRDKRLSRLRNSPDWRDKRSEWGRAWFMVTLDPS